MSAPANIRVNTSVPFPALVRGSGMITIAKSFGQWIVGFSMSSLSRSVPTPAALATDYVLVYDSIANSYSRVALTDLAAASVSVLPTFLTAAGTYTVTTETSLLVNRTVPAAANIQLPTAASRNGIPIIIKDYAGNAATYNSTILPNGAELIDGLASIPLNANYGGFKLYPISTGGWYISP